jgi:hypothetical protein
MSVPSSYSASELAAYMHGELGRVADALGFTAPASYGQAIVRTLTAYGVSSIASATNVPRLLALSSVEAWRLAVQQLTPQFNINTDGRGESRAGFYEHARDMLADAEAYALTIPDDGTGVDRAEAGRVIVRYRCDPYS